jgi:acetoin:2,6-dichlorophenolindophenol oxidoreductase subunit alpha
LRSDQAIASPAMSRLDLLRWMQTLRKLDQLLSAENPRWFTAEGEEATIVGSFCDLRPTDAAAPHYRGPFAVYLMRGAEMWRLAAQVLRKDAGYNRGRSVPFNGPVELGIVPWVAGDLGTTLGVATGAALAFQDEGTDNVCVCTFGDGTANRGDFHEAVNLAACWKLPIVYVCQNNGWAISQPASTYLSAPVASRAAGYGIPGLRVDGYDVEAVRAAVGEAIERARRGHGPSLIEALCWRAAGHWGGDTAEYRDSSPPADYRDPIELLRERLLAGGEATRSMIQAVFGEIEVEVERAVQRALAEPDASERYLGLEEVFA